MTRRTFLAAAAGPPPTYPLYRAKGSHRELGRQHGEQASAKVAAHVDYMMSSGGMSRAVLHARAMKFLPLFERHCPHLADEMRGLGEGARVPFAEALACNIRGEITRAPEGGCTAYAIRGRSIIAGQNSDMTPEIPPLGYVLHLAPIGKPDVMMWTFGGMIGYHGINSAGVGHFANALGGGPEGRFAMPHYPVKRMMLECANLDQVTDLLRRIPLASNGNYVLCDSERVLDIEATTSGPELLPDGGTGYVVHTNHFVCSRYSRRENHAQSWKDSFPRLARIDSLIADRRGAVSIDDVKKFLSDHDGHPTSICRHDGASVTVASIIAEPARRRMHVAVGNPCANRYATYSI